MAIAKKDIDESAGGWKRAGVRALKLSRALYFVLGVAVGLAADALNIPKSLVEFKSNAPEAKDYVYSLIYRPSNWSGIFDTYPEGLVDMNALGIGSAVEVALEIDVVEGNRIDGRIWWVGSCDLGSPYQGLLIEGRIRAGGTLADVQVFDFMNGHRVTFLSGQLSSDGIIVEFRNFPERFMLNGSRIAKNPDPASIENWDDLYCG